MEKAVIKTKKKKERALYKQAQMQNFARFIKSKEMLARVIFSL